MNTQEAMESGYLHAADQSIERQEAEAAVIVAKTNEITVIVDAAGESRAAEFLKQIKLRLNEVDAARVKLLGPIKEHVKRIEQEFKRVSGPLQQADEAVRAAMTAYRNSPVFKEAEAARRQIEQDARTAVSMGDMKALESLAADHAQASIAAPTKVETASGEARFRKTWRWEVSDIETLPAAYWTPDEKKIAAAVKAGIPVPGVKAWQEETPIIV